MQADRTLLQYANSALDKNDQKWTAPRRAVYDALAKQKQPMSAYQLMDYIVQHGGQSFKPPSIYRALAFFQEMGLVFKIESTNAFILSANPDHSHPHVMLLCDSCGHADELCAGQVGKNFSDRAAQKGFKVSRPVFELHGSCQDCQS
jgi:Fur family zinc uptake transcriptional regulator